MALQPLISDRIPMPDTFLDKEIKGARSYNFGNFSTDRIVIELTKISLNNDSKTFEEL